MSTSVTIGEFSRLTHLTVKTLRHYHEQGLLVPYAVDGASGYRRYSVDQVPDALLIGRLRRLDMPLAEVRRVLDSTDTAERDAAIADHLPPDGGGAEPDPGDRRLPPRPARPPRRAWRCSVGTLPDLAAVSVTARVRAGRHRRTGAQQTFTELYQGLRQPAGRAGRRALRRGVLHRGRG